MQLFADRFVLVDDQTAVDLATGESVALTIAPAGDACEQGRWLIACDTAERSHHPALPRLIDFGTVGTAHRFEARARPVDRDAGSAAEVPSLVIVPRPAVALIGELFERPHDRRPAAVAIWGPRGAGKHTIVAELARTARRHGFVPVAASVLATFADELRGRSLFVIDREQEAASRTAWLRSAIETPRPHVLLVVSLAEPWAIDGVRLEPLAIDTLVGAVRPRAANGRELAALRRVARESRGWPGRFARLLWRLPGSGAISLAMPGALRAAEQTAVFGVEAPAIETAVQTGETGGAYAPASDSALWRRRAEAGSRLAGEGKHVAAERILRQAIGALSRRRDWAAAGESGLALAALLLRRGRPRDAHDTLQAAAGACQRAGDEGPLIDVAILTGVAAIELARLDHAEATLAAAVATARSRGDGVRLCRAVNALARTLFWSARYDDADAALKSAASSADRGSGVHGSGLEVAIAVGQGDLSRAIARGSELLARAETVGDARQIAIAACRAALAHLAVGDLAAVDRDAATAVAAARRCREPLLAFRARLVLAEALRRGGRQAAASRLLARARRLGAQRLPPIVQARLDLLRELITPARAPHEIVKRHVEATGLGALALYGPAVAATGAHAVVTPAVAGLIEILDLCQASEDEQIVLTEVCRRARSQLHAAAVAMVVRSQAAPAILAADGGRIDLDAAERAMTATVGIAPQRGGDRVEAAAPIRYGGVAIGAVAARWTIATPYDLAPALPLMAAIAAAVAPIVSAAQARAPRPDATSMPEMIGSSAAMREVRRGIERAAAAPFAVLIEGESGTGKELVARALHRRGPRRDRVFRTLNCAALPDDLVESELFGHARGAFTGAAGDRLGVFEEASGGTLFLDEVGELSPRAQAKVLRVIQEGELRRVGENVTRRVDVRIVAATNRDLRQEVAAGRFRLDLLYRLDVVRISMPALRERREDVPALIEHFWREAAARVSSRATLSAAVLARLAHYEWPGNVRELQNTLASLAVRTGRRGVVAPAALGPQFGDRRLDEAMRLEDARRTFEERFVRAALVRTGGHRGRAAAELGVSRQGLTKLMVRLGITEKGADP